MLQAFTDAYIEAMLSVGVCLPEDDSSRRDFTRADIANIALSEIMIDCAIFHDAYGRLWRDDTQAGHDFYLTRNRHGAGFWDRDPDNYEPTDDVPDPGRYLTEQAHIYGTQGLCLGDDGRLYVHS